MSEEHDPDRVTDQLTVYQIKTKGYLGQHWIAWFEELSIILEENGDTLLTSAVVDQTVMHSILKKVRDLGVPFLSINSVGAGPHVRSDTGSNVRG